jgi:hypothetical protein
MTLQDVGSIGELIGSIATVAMLFYLAVQIRQNTAALKGTAHETVTSRISNFNIALGSDPATSALFRSGLERPDELSTEECAQFVLLISSVFGGIETYILAEQAREHRDGAVGALALHSPPVCRESWGAALVGFGRNGIYRGIRAVRRVGAEQNRSSRTRRGWACLSAY